MTTNWIPVITDRTEIDVMNVANDPTLSNPKGCYNYTDLNRIENNTQYCLEYMLEREIIEEAPELRIKTDWTADEVISYEELERIITNIQELGAISNPEIRHTLPDLYPTTQMNYILANKIEEYLDIMHTQAETPVDHYFLRINHGIITTIEGLDGTIRNVNADSTWIAEDEIATIRGYPYGENIPFQRFDYWSGNEEDLEYLDDITSETTTYVAQPREVLFSANYKVVLERRLILTNAYISPDGNPQAETGPTQGEYYAGDRVMIIANTAPMGKTFYSWKGTQAALNTMNESEIRQSTIWFTMPDSNVELNAFYINAGPHYVRVYTGDGLVSEQSYNYDEYFSITAPDRGSKYTFASWSGDTFYLDNIYNATTSGKMPDVDVMINANYDYKYATTNVTMQNNSTIDGKTYLSGIQEGSTHTIICNPPNGSGFFKWILYGMGEIVDEYANPTQYIAGIHNAGIVISPQYKLLQTLTVINTNNEGNSVVTQKVQNTDITISTEEVVGDYIFDYWSENGENVSTSSMYSFTMPNTDRALTAVYRLKTNVNVIIDYGSHSETVTMLERSARAITADPPPTGKQFDYWDGTNIYSIEDRWNNITSFISDSSDGTITANYYTPSGPINEYTLTVNDGSGSGQYEENSSVIIEADAAPVGYEFDYWEVNSGPGYVSNTYSISTKFNMGTGNAIITAHYKQIPSFLITVNNGYVLLNGIWVNSGMCLRNSNPQIKIKPAPSGQRFESWNVIEGDMSDITEPLAETTTLRNVTHNISIEAEYYVPYSSTTYTVTLRKKDHTATITSHATGDEVNIIAETPDEGYVFYRWNGDYQYLMSDRTVRKNKVKMPAKNIELWPSYVPNDYTVKYNLYMYNAECLISRTEDPDTHEITEVWSSSGEFEEGDIVEIRPTTITTGWRFNGWETPNVEQTTLIDNTEIENTFITISNFDCYVTATIIENNKYSLQITNGYTSGQFYENARVPIYFYKPNTFDFHYTFNKWTGEDLAYIKLYDGSPFSAITAGDSEHPQYIRMPAEKIRIAAQYIINYHVTIYMGKMDNNETSGYFAPNTTINITANAPQEGYIFQKWVGDTANIGSIWDPTTTLTVTDHIKSVTAIYSRLSDRNDIGYVLTSLVESDNINVEDITIISGEIQPGFIITDSIGHLYTITSINDTTASITRLTRTQKGGNIYE